MLWQPALPDRYLSMSEDELRATISARRRELGSRLLILGHHYQQDEVIRHADLTGDSLRLSRLAADEAPKRGTEFIVFCGVHFMAETADILTDPSVAVILPDLSAGCSMADMAAYDDTVEAWERIHDALKGHRTPTRVIPTGALRSALRAHTRSGADRTSGESDRQSANATRVIPITYVNSTAAIKAFVGEHGGACCTSSNAAQVFDWALAGGTVPKSPDEEIRILFLPDQHLGRNTASARGFLTEVDERAGLGASDTAVYDPRKPDGGISDERIRATKILLWAGHCSVHKLFRPEHVDQLRAEPANADGINVLVHPECVKEVVDKADLVGSTEYIIGQIERAEVGSRWAIGTEIHLVNRLAAAARERGVFVRILSDCQCLCTTMYRIDQAHLLWVLDNLAEGRVVNRVEVHPEAAALARLALDRMLANVSDGAGARARKPPASALVD